MVENPSSSAAQGEIDLARKLALARSWSESLPHWQRAAQLFADLSDQLRLADAEMGWGQALCGLLGFESSVGHFARAEEAYRAAGDVGGQAVACFLHAQTFVFMGRHADSFDYWRRAEGLYSAIGSPSGREASLQGLSAAVASIGG